MNRKNKTSRRQFLRSSATAVGATAASFIIPATALGRGALIAANDRIAMGFIGMGTMGTGHVFGRAWTYLPGGYISRKDVQVAAICDVWTNKRDESKANVDKQYAEMTGQKDYRGCAAYTDFRDLLADKNIDAVLIATPIHWHATMAVMAAKAGKDVYCEKPTAVTIHESQALVKAVKENKRIYQAGTQQRSEYDHKFRTACEYVRSGRIGELQTIYAFRDGGGVIWPETYEETKPIPKELDWDLWLGPAPMMPYQGRSDAHLFGFGGINWGQHHYDIVQWSLDADRTGPIELFVDEGAAAYKYANGVTVYGRPYPNQEISTTGGAWFIGTEGKIAVDREHLISEPASILEKPLGPNDVHLYKSDSHSGNFLDCIKTRKPAICDVETAHHAASVMLLGGIVQQLKRPLKWDPKKEQFIGDDEANKKLAMVKREPWVV